MHYLLSQHPTFLSRPLTLTADDESTTHFTVTFQIQAACCLPAGSISCAPPFPCSLKTSAGRGRLSVHIDNSSVQFNGEVWELRPQQRAHNWHPSCLIKGKSTGMDPQISAFIGMVCKQNHTETDTDVTHRRIFVLGQ